MRLLAFLLVFTSSSFAGDIDSDVVHNVRSAIEAAKTALAGKPEDATPIVESLVKYKYQEVVDFALSQLEEQTRSSRPNIYHIRAFLKIVAAVAGRDSVDRFKSIQTAFANQHNAQSWYQDLSKNLRSTDIKIGTQGIPAHLPPAKSVREQLAGKITNVKSPLGMFMMATSEFLTDTVMKRLEKNEWVPIVGREAETDRALDTLIRIKGRVPVFKGLSGVGKTAVMEQIAYLTYIGKLPPGLYQKEIHNSVFVSTTSAQLSLLASSPLENSMRAGVEIYLEGLLEAQKLLDRPIVLCIDEAHTLSSGQMNGLKSFIENQDNAGRIMLATTGKELSFSLAQDPAFMRRVEEINMEEFDPEKTFSIIKNTWLKVYENRYNVIIPDDVLRAIIAVAPEVRPDIFRVAGPLKVLEDYAIVLHRQHMGEVAEGNKKGVFAFAAQATGRPVVAQDREAFIAYMEKMREEVKLKVRGQDHAVDTIIDQFSNSLTSNQKKHSVVMVAGTTGTGKSYTAEVLAEKYFGNKNRYLELDMTEYVGQFGANGLFGTVRGTVGFTSGKGKICEFFDGPGKGGGIIVMNEIEKTGNEAVKKMMEMLDKGIIPCTDGTPRNLGRSLIIMTTNKGARSIMPPDYVKSATCAQLESKAKGVTAGEIKKAFSTKETYTQKDEPIPVEILERVDEYVFTTPLCIEIATQIANDNVKYFIQSEKESGNSTEINVDVEFGALLTKSIYDPNLGARQVKRAVEKFLKRAMKEHYSKYKATSKLSIAISRKDNLTPSTLITVTDEQGRSVQVDGPVVKVDNKMFDNEFRNRLKNLPQNLAKHVKGQPGLINAVVRAVKGRVTNIDGKSPASVFVVGLTGTGKTEVAKALAQELYGIELAEKCIIPMGNVATSHDLDNVFSPSKSSMGSDSEGLFESCIKALVDSGGVVVFDEMSNAGGNNKTAKNEIMKQFYQILDEGVWCNPSGQCYSLKNITMIFTGNDGQELFKGMSSDDLLKARWNEVGSTPDKVRKILVEHGAPEPFLGRIPEVVMTEPLTGEIKTAVSDKLKNSWLKEAFSKQPFDIEFSKDFDEKVGRLVFNSQEGGRSIRNFLNSEVGAIINEALYQYNWDDLKTKRGSIKIWIEDSSPTKPFYTIKQAPKKAEIKILAKMGDDVIYEGSGDFTAKAQFISQIRKVDAWGTAYHEAGHALLNDPIKTGKRLDYVTIVPKDGYLGYARYEPLPGTKTDYSQADIDYLVTQLIAGSIAEELIGRQPNSGKAKDMEDIGKILDQAAFKAALVPGLETVRKDEKDRPILSKEQKDIFEEYSKKVLEAARASARTQIKENWLVMRYAADWLMKKGYMNGDDFENIKKNVANMSPTKRRALEEKSGLESVAKSLVRFDKHCAAALTGNHP